MTILSIPQCDVCTSRFDPDRQLTELTLIHESGPYEEPDTDTVHVCLDCGTPSLRDTVEVVRKYRVTNAGAVDQLYFPSQREWVATDDLQENPYIVDAIDFIESELLNSSSAEDE